MTGRTRNVFGSAIVQAARTREINVEFHRRAHLPILLASDLFHQRVPIPWWNNLPLRLSTYTGSPKGIPLS